MRQIVIDCTQFSSRDAFHDVISQALAFPQWYGRNLDALHDCISSIPEETHLILQNWQAAEDTLGNYASVIRTVLIHAEDDSLLFHLSFQ